MSLENFHEGRLPSAIGFGASGGPVWHTEIIALASGREVRNSSRALSRRRWDVTTPALSPAQFASLQAFFEARKGRFGGFRFRDPSCCSTAAEPGRPVSPTDQFIAAGDGLRSDFQLVFGPAELAKPILKPVGLSLLVAIDGTAMSHGWSVGETDGALHFDTAPAAGAVITAGFEFDWPVRFDTDHLDTTFDQPGAGRVLSLPLIELV